ncbi:hypothetical protein WN943_019708 [Citrus x changshan-huyou]
MEERLLGSEAKDIDDLKGRVWKESKKLWRVAFPAMLARVSQYGMFVITQGFIGNLGEVELAASALIQIIAVRFSNGILIEDICSNSIIVATGRLAQPSSGHELRRVT